MTMATGGILPVYEYKLTNGIALTVTQGDILKADASAIVVGEDSELRGHGGVSKKLLKISPKEFLLARDSLKSKTLHYGRVYCCEFPAVIIPKFKDTVQFNVVLYAIVPPYLGSKSKRTSNSWEEDMRLLYHSVIDMANTKGKRSLGMPVLGSGGAGAPPEIATEILAQSLTTYSTKVHNLEDIIICCHQEKIFSELVAKLNHHNFSPGKPSLSQMSAPVSGLETTGNIRRSLADVQAVKGRSKIKGDLETSAPCSTDDSEIGANSDSNLPAILGKLHLQQDEDSNEKSDAEEMDFESHREDQVDVQKNGNESKRSEEDDTCAICLDKMQDPKKLDKCGHTFCKDCIESSFRHHKPACPACNTMYGLVTGNQPKGTMTVRRDRNVRLPGYQNCGVIIIDYYFPSGTQGANHPHPGQMYSGTQRQAFLPDTEEGKKVCRLLRVAFDNRLTFTVGSSRTTGADNVVTWNDIHHKTNIEGGTTYFGYPDSLYLSRVQEELAAKGVTEECLKGKKFDI